MKQFDRLFRFKKMNRLIQSGQTGTPAEFAQNLGISQSHLFRSIHLLEKYGIAIKYSRTLRTYFCENEKAVICESPTEMTITSGVFHPANEKQNFKQMK